MTPEELEAIREIATRAESCGDAGHEINVAGEAYTNCCDRWFERKDVAAALLSLSPLLAEVERLQETPRYWAFAYDQFYPAGGVNDLVGRFATKEGALAALAAYERRSDAEYVVDITTGEMVEETT